MGEFLSVSRLTELVVLSLVLCASLIFVQLANAQPVQTGFLSIDCGTDTSYIDPVTTIQWQPDTNFISTGYTAAPVQSLTDNLTDMFSEFRTLRFFNDSSYPKYCYSLPVTENTSYSLRATFFYGDSNAAGPDPPSFRLALDATIMVNVTTDRDFAYYYEFTYLSRGNITYLCLLRDETRHNPFISAISLRPAVMYRRFDGYFADNKYIRTRARYNFGGADRVRFPTDVHDRYWNPIGPNSTQLRNNTTPIQILSTTTKLDLSDYGTIVPEVVLQTAVTAQGNMTIQLTNYESPYSYLILHFAELDNHTSNVSRKFMVEVPDVSTDSYVNPWNYSLEPFKPMFWYFWGVSLTSDSDKITFYPRPRSRLGPLLNAMEIYTVVDIAAYTTSAQDAQAIEAIKKSMNLTEWTGDPCLPVPHSWVTCNLPGPMLQLPRVDQLSLSGYNLQGTIPASSFALLDVSSLSLDNNAFTGTFPDVSSMTTLQQLHLHNNQLSGPLPDWLANMTSLQELSIQNNNFSGTIPPQLLARNALNFTYRPGNPWLIGPDSTSNNTVGSTGTKPVVRTAYMFATVTTILSTLYM
ncbi:hypothetical protein KC19_2G258400 [Ceratodon purpureus]|uniref:Malectin-like domain-containing protein n=1 Tax=Ceratodon purpureus TaxID=3225 RepID=A0A8T0IY20_CERPU|nr:hypothetical protein KC19_2G258400 [Ceratodon purpureus]